MVETGYWLREVLDDRPWKLAEPPGRRVALEVEVGEEGRFVGVLAALATALPAVLMMFPAGPPPMLLPRNMMIGKSLFIVVQWICWCVP